MKKPHIERGRQGVPGGDTECHTGKGITCQTGRNGQCDLFRPFLHLPFDILLPHPVLSLGYLSQINLTRATIIMWISELILTTCVLPAGPGRERERERERDTHTHAIFLR